MISCWVVKNEHYKIFLTWYVTVISRGAGPDKNLKGTPKKYWQTHVEIFIRLLAQIYVPSTSAKTSQVIMIDLLSFHPDLLGWQIAHQIVCCEGYKTVGGISYEPTRHATPDHIWIKCWGWMFYSQQMVKWDQGGLEWSLPPELQHWQLSSEKQTGDLWPLAVAGAEQVSGSHNIIPKHGLSRSNIKWLGTDNNCLTLMRAHTL